MIYEHSTTAVAVFAVFVAAVLGLSFVLGGKAKSTKGYFAAHGEIHWFINGIAFAGDYLSAASFLGITGAIARLRNSTAARAASPRASIPASSIFAST